MVALRQVSRWTLIAAILFSGFDGCSRSPHDKSFRPEALILCPGATKTKWLKFEGTDQLSYEIAVEYPADTILSCISTQLLVKGWHPLKEDFWNPGLLSSPVRGWTQFVDVTVRPEATVDQWAAQWSNTSGDVVWYSLRYVYPPGDRQRLAVNAGLIPAKIAKKMSRAPEPLQTGSGPAQETSGPHSIAKALFPNAPEKVQSASCFRALQPEMSVNTVVQKCGSPDEELGSGIYIFVWHLADGSTVSIGTASMQKIGDIRFTDSSGKTSTLLEGQSTRKSK